MKPEKTKQLKANDIPEVATKETAHAEKHVSTRPAVPRLAALKTNSSSAINVPPISPFTSLFTPHSPVFFVTSPFRANGPTSAPPILEIRGNGSLSDDEKAYTLNAGNKQGLVQLAQRPVESFAPNSAPVKISRTSADSASYQNLPMAPSSTPVASETANTTFVPYFYAPGSSTLAVPQIFMNGMMPSYSMTGPPPSPPKSSPESNGSPLSNERWMPMLASAVNSSAMAGIQSPNVMGPHGEGSMMYVMNGSGAYPYNPYVMIPQQTMPNGVGFDRSRGETVMQNGKPKRRPTKWEDHEIRLLIQGVKKHGVGNWSKISKDQGYGLYGRTSADLYEKWRLLVMTPKSLQRQLEGKDPVLPPKLAPYMTEDEFNNLQRIPSKTSSPSRQFQDNRHHELAEVDLKDSNPKSSPSNFASPSVGSVPEVEQILDAKIEDGDKFYVLIKWKKMPASETTWELLDDLIDCEDRILAFLYSVAASTSDSYSHDFSIDPQSAAKVAENLVFARARRQALKRQHSDTDDSSEPPSSKAQKKYTEPEYATGVPRGRRLGIRAMRTASLNEVETGLTDSLNSAPPESSSKNTFMFFHNHSTASL